MFGWFKKINDVGIPTAKELDRQFKARPRDMTFLDFIKKYINRG